MLAFPNTATNYKSMTPVSPRLNLPLFTSKHFSTYSFNQHITHSIFFLFKLVFIWWTHASRYVGSFPTTTWISREDTQVPFLLSCLSPHPRPQLGHCSAPGWAPWVTQHLSTSHLFYVWSCICSTLFSQFFPTSPSLAVPKVCSLWKSPK